MKIVSPQFPQLPLSPVQNRPTNAPLQDDASLEEDADLFKKSMSDEDSGISEQPAQSASDTWQSADGFTPALKRRQGGSEDAAEAPGEDAAEAPGEDAAEAPG